MLSAHAIVSRFDVKIAAALSVYRSSAASGCFHLYLHEANVNRPAGSLTKAENVDLAAALYDARSNSGQHVFVWIDGHAATRARTRARIARHSPAQRRTGIAIAVHSSPLH